MQNSINQISTEQRPGIHGTHFVYCLAFTLEFPPNSIIPLFILSISWIWAPSSLWIPLLSLSWLFTCISTSLIQSCSTGKPTQTSSPPHLPLSLAPFTLFPQTTPVLFTALQNSRPCMSYGVCANLFRVDFNTNSHYCKNQSAL